MIKKFILTAAAALSLSACEVPVMIAAGANDGALTGFGTVTFPVVMIVERSDGFAEVLEGKLNGHLNGSADYVVASPTMGRCVGRYENDGTNRMACENGFQYAKKAEKMGAKMSGVNVEFGENGGVTYVVGFGWGNNANENDVRAAIDAERSANDV